MHAELAKAFEILDTEFLSNPGRFLSPEDKVAADALPANEKRAVYFEAILKTLRKEQAHADEAQRLKDEAQQRQEAEARLLPRGADKVAAAIAHVKGKAVEG